jgi:dolichol-phosphate mannosyltransferase
LKAKKTLISIIIPLLNEEDNICALYDSLVAVFKKLKDYDYELIYVDDGSTDSSIAKIQSLEKKDSKVRLIRLARNFGKEIATTAGLHHSRGEAAIMIDSDLQHPPEVIPAFLEKWRQGYEVVTGKRKAAKEHASYLKRITSVWFYKFINKISNVPITPNATDFRLLDRSVINEFNKFTERNRLTRGLIDWLGFCQAYVEFMPAKRLYGQASYTYAALVKLAVNTIISLSFFPLRIAGYLGAIIVLVSGPLGILVLIERYFLDDRFGLHFSGTAILAVILLFLVGIVLVCLGFIALYIADIHGEVSNRPLYVEKRRPERNC